MRIDVLERPVSNLWSVGPVVEGLPALGHDARTVDFVALAGS